MGKKPGYFIRDVAPVRDTILSLFLIDCGFPFVRVGNGTKPHGGLLISSGMVIAVFLPRHFNCMQ